MAESNVAAYLEIIRGRWPGLSKKQMAEDAGLSSNYIYRIEGGMQPSPSRLEALCRKWSRTAEEYREDYRQLMSRAGYSAPLAPSPNVAERSAFIEEIINMLEGLTEEQQRDIHARIAAYRANNLLGKRPSE